MALRWVVAHPKLGVYLGGAFGFGFWSLLDPVGQDGAFAFRTKSEAEGFLTLLVEAREDARPVPLEVADQAYATIAECVAAGLPGWDPADRGGRPGAIGVR